MNDYIRECRKCKKNKVIEAFKMNNGKPLHTCKECIAFQQRALRYKITQKELTELLKIKECEICKKPFLPSTLQRDNKCIDHNHKSGKVRGVLCYNCNTALGKFKDDWEVLFNAIKYLRNYE